MSARLAALLVLACLAGGARAAAPGPAELARVQEDIDNWRIDSARWRTDRMLERAPQDAAALLAAARVAFYESDYPRARDLVARAGKASKEGTPEHEEAVQFGAYLDERAPTWSTFSEHRTENFVIRTTPRDALLVPYAARALEAAAAAVGEDLGWCPQQPVVVELYPSRSTFIAASTLTQQEVETSGTVAICHFNRLMVISPGVMEHGYEWLDTLCHEYVHYAVYHVGGESVPVWLHEGIAKTLESRWREPRPERLDPRLESVLAEGAQAGKWVTFEEMSPSMAKLPSAGLVTLAFAQVSTGIRMLMEEAGGPAPVRALLGELAVNGGDVDAALRTTTGDSLEDFERHVRRSLAARPLTRIPGTELLSEEKDPLARDFKPEGGGQSDPEADARQLQDRQARDWVLLADRLRGREFHDAALIEYDKALGRLGESQPGVVSRKAATLITLGRLDEARAILEECLRYYPDLTMPLDNLSEVHVRLARRPGVAPAAAREHELAALALARRSEMVNPFNADTHVRLAAILTRLGRTAEAEESRERLELLRRIE